MNPVDLLHHGSKSRRQEDSSQSILYMWVESLQLDSRICGSELPISRLRDELLNRELFLSVNELRYVADRWRMDYNHYRPHSSLD